MAQSVTVASGWHGTLMSHNYDMQPDLSPEDYAALAALLRDTIKADRFPLSPRIRSLKAILDKLEPPAPKREPLPPLKPPGEPSLVVARMRGTKRRRR